ncbi:MAG: M23 family metallopeptidase [Desulfovibrionaceae bacterium]
MLFARRALVLLALLCLCPSAPGAEEIGRPLRGPRFVELVSSYPDIDGDGRAFDGSARTCTGHEGTDFAVPIGTPVYASLAGQVLWVFDGKYDICPDAAQPDCQAPPEGWFVAGQSNGYRVCTDAGPYGQYSAPGTWFYCFDGGNVVVIRHQDGPVFATRYDHLKSGSITVAPGDMVARGQRIAESASAGRSTGPHLHFEVWGRTYYDPIDPWDNENITFAAPNIFPAPILPLLLSD